MSKCYASAVIATAEAEVGYKEKETNASLDSKTANAGDGNYTKYARDFDEKYPDWYNGKKNGYAWCDMFVDWCFLTTFGYEKALELLCQPEKSAGAGCTYSYKYYKAKDQVGDTPKVGAQIFFGSVASNLNHTGLVYKVDSSKVYTIEGNSSNQVKKCSYSLTSSKIFGYGYPAYDEETTTSSASSASSSSSSSSGSTASGFSSSSSGTSSSTVKVDTAKSKMSGYSKGKSLKTTANLRLRTGAGTGKTIIKVLSKGSKVTWYGYYTTVSGVKWYLIVDSTGQSGFMSSQYLA